jgi:tellurite methyltransferase
MTVTPSVAFFESQFQRQVRDGDFALNPFERAALPYLHGRTLDFGCGLGNLAVAAAERGCSVAALDASHTAIEHLRQVASERALPIEAYEAELRDYELREDFDAVVSIGLLMFFECPAAFRQLSELQSHVRRDGIAVVNVLVEGTTYLDMFDPRDHCLFARDEMRRRFDGWNVLRCDYQDFDAPNRTVKSFVTLVAKKPPALAGSGPTRTSRTRSNRRASA